MDLSQLGPFTIEERLGTDAASSIFRAIHINRQRPVALKIFPADEILSHPEWHQKAIIEFATLKQLRHSHLLRTYGGGFDGSYGYLVMKLLRGESLARLLERRERLPWEHVIEIATAIASVLEHTHRTSRCHGRLDLDKVLISKKNKVKVTGWFQTSWFETVNPCMDSVRFRAPEQLISTLQTTTQSDLYTLGALMYCMLAGQPANCCQSIEELVHHQHEPDLQPVSQIAIDCPIWIDALVHQLMETDPANRPYSAAAVLIALKQSREHIEQGTSVATHAMAGFSPISIPGAQQNIHQAMGKPETIKPRPSILERKSFLATSLVILVTLVVAVLYWPVQEATLFHKAEQLMTTGNPANWQEARRRYLIPLLARFPQGEYSEKAQQYLDQINITNVEKRLRTKIRLGRQPNNEGERLLMEAWQIEQFGDHATALKRYQALIVLLANQPEARIYRELALQYV
ncbi:MAG: protein kinase, partial [Planctomycetaceae bacterium]|nr:protein kinase [Planctomycetaceae bacterium]